MEVPEHVVSALDLIPEPERNRLLRSLDQLNTWDGDRAHHRIPIAKLQPTNLYIYRGSARVYRIIFELGKDFLRVTDIIHRDRIKLVLGKHSSLR